MSPLSHLLVSIAVSTAAHSTAPLPQAVSQDLEPLRPVLSLGDFDGDGWLDAFAIYEGGEDRLWRNLGDGTFEDATERAGLAGLAGSLGAAWIDYDDDGRLDLYVIASRTERRLFRNLEGGAFEDATASAGLAGVADEIAATWVDFNDDGYEDLFVRTASGDLLFHNNGRGQLEAIDLGAVERALALAPFASSEADAAIERDGAAPAPRPRRPMPPFAPPSSRAASSRSAGPSAGASALLPGGTAPVQPLAYCQPSLVDQAGGPCIRASSVPALGKLYPLSSNLFVDAATGNVGIGTTVPMAPLHLESGSSPSVVLDSTTSFPSIALRSLGGAWASISSWYGALALLGGPNGNVALSADSAANGAHVLVSLLGRVGIGRNSEPVLSPPELLTVQSSSNPRILVNSNDGTSSGVRLEQGGVTRASLVVNSGNAYLDSGAGITLQLRAEGTAGLSIVPGGNVLVPGGSLGIGTSAPAARLHVSSASTDVARIETGASAARLVLEGAIDSSITPSLSSPSKSLTVSGGPGGGWMTVSGGLVDVVGTGEGSTVLAGAAPLGDVIVSTNGATRMIVDQDGRVGVGTMSPVSTLSVAGSADVSSSLGVGTTAPMRPLHVRSDDDLARFEGTSGYLDVVNTAPSGLMLSTDGTGPFAIRTAGGSGSGQVFVDTAGRVGIGTDSPSSTLSVSGSGSVSTSLSVGASVGIGTSTPTAPLDVRGGNAWTTWNKSVELDDGSALKWRGSGAGWRHGIVQGANGLEVIRAQVDDGSASHQKSIVVGNDGSVGIGVGGAPDAKLHVSDGAPASVFGLGQIAITGAGVQALSINTVGSGSCGVFLHNNGANAWRVSADRATDDFVIANDSAGVPWAGPALVTVKDNGDVGIGTTTPLAKLDVDGTTRTQCVTITGGCDIVEGFDTGDVPCEPGTVLVIDPRREGELRASTEPYDKKVAGVVSGAGGVRPGLALAQEGTLDGETKVAMAGRVYVKCSAENGAIEPGDRLTTASLAGHAMKATDGERCDGAVLGKAMSSLTQGTGLVLVLVNLQ